MEWGVQLSFMISIGNIFNCLFSLTTVYKVSQLTGLRIKSSLE